MVIILSRKRSRLFSAMGALALVSACGPSGGGSSGNCAAEDADKLESCGNSPDCSCGRTCGGIGMCGFWGCTSDQSCVESTQGGAPYCVVASALTTEYTLCSAIDTYPTNGCFRQSNVDQQECTSHNLPPYFYSCPQVGPSASCVTTGASGANVGFCCPDPGPNEAASSSSSPSSRSSSSASPPVAVDCESSTALGSLAEPYCQCTASGTGPSATYSGAECNPGSHSGSYQSFCCASEGYPDEGGSCDCYVSGNWNCSYIAQACNCDFTTTIPPGSSPNPPACNNSPGADGQPWVCCADALGCSCDEDLAGCNSEQTEVTDCFANPATLGITPPLTGCPSGTRSVTSCTP